MWRIRQQVIYLFWAIVIIVSIVAGFYWYTKPVPTCFDGKLNGNETGTDCGGSCRLVCLADTSSVVNEWVRVLPQYSADGIFENKITVMAMNKNPNNSVIESLKYRLLIFNEQGEQVVDIENETTANPLEEFLIFENDISLNDPNPTRVFIEFEGEKWLKPLQKTPKISARAVEYEDGNFSRLTAEVINESLIDLKNIRVTAVLIDEKGSVFAGSQTILESLPKESRKTVFFTWPGVLNQSPVEFLIVPQVNIFELQ